MTRVLVIGAGIGGLTTAVELAKFGLDVTVLEAHVEPGGCAATFFHKGYRFDAGATLAGGFASGAPMDLLAQRFDINWEARPATAAMQVHLADGTEITRWSNPKRWQEERLSQFGESAEEFWNWQEKTADKLWQLTAQQPPWPPQNFSNFVSLSYKSLHWLCKQNPRGYAQLIKDAFQPTSKRLIYENYKLRQFVDAQLLISAQATSQQANALYSAAALDLARLGVVHLPGGMGSIAKKLAERFQYYGGKTHYRQTVMQVHRTGNNLFEVQTKRGASFLADNVIFNLTPWNIKSLLGEAAPNKLHRLPKQPEDGWGAFMIYAGIPEDIIPKGLPLHQQVIGSEPLGEGNSIFMSLSPAWDAGRVPPGQRAVTISTHTRLAPWWQLYQENSNAYEDLKERYTENILTLSEHILPGLATKAALVMPGTPVTFERFTRRDWGWVGGFPQTSLFRGWGPRLAPGMWMVGDSIFPGQSVPAVALGGLRVAQGVLASQRKSQQTVQFRTPKQQRAKTLS
jgi:C-3',4' desaturase CrtD